MDAFRVDGSPIVVHPARYGDGRKPALGDWTITHEPSGMSLPQYGRDFISKVKAANVVRLFLSFIDPKVLAKPHTKPGTKWMFAMERAWMLALGQPAVGIRQTFTVSAQKPKRRAASKR